MSIFSLFNMAQAANPKAEVTIRSGGHDAIIITWRWKLPVPEPQLLQGSNDRSSFWRI